LTELDIQLSPKKDCVKQNIKIYDSNSTLYVPMCSGGVTHRIRLTMKTNFEGKDLLFADHSGQNLYW